MQTLFTNTHEQSLNEEHKIKTASKQQINRARTSPSKFILIFLVYLFVGLFMLLCAPDISDTFVRVMMYIGAFGCSIFAAFALSVYEQICQKELA